MSIPPHICLVSATSKVEFEELKLIADAIDKELHPFCDAWDLERWRCDAVRGLTPTHVRVSQFILTITDSSTVEGALGWHAEEGGKVFGEIGAGDILRSGGKLHTRGSYPSVSSVIAHEVFETILNPSVNLWVDRGDGVSQDAREACDAVQGSSFDVGARAMGGSVKQVDIANYLLPAWFDAQALAGPYDKMGVCSAPFEVQPSGYHVVRTAGVETAEDGTEKAVFRTESVGAPGIVARALTKRRPRALLGHDLAFQAPPAPPPPVVEDDAPAPEPELETATTEPAPVAEGDPSASRLSPFAPLDILPDLEG